MASQTQRFQKASAVGQEAAWGYEAKLTAAYASLLKQASDQAASMLPRITMAAAGKPTPQWTKPHEAELGDQLRGIYATDKRTTPIRVEAMRAVTTPPLAVIGLNFSLRNPFIQGALKQAGQHITGIVETTRQDLMGIIDDSWQKGLSIPNTATALRAYGLDNARAVLIARTELIGISNGGSHAAAATSQSESLAGDDQLPPLTKIWLTAEDELVRDTHVQAGDDYGAGSGIALDDTFSVGDSDMQYPGDPDGDAEEVCNCRCAVSYEEGGLAAAAQARRYRGGRMRNLTAGASGSTSLPLSDQDHAWDAAAAQKTLSPEQFADAHFWQDPDAPSDQITSYKLPFAEVIDGTLTAVWKGVTAVAGVLQGSMGGTKDVDDDAVKPKVAAYYSKAATKYGDETIKPPWEDDAKASIRAAAVPGLPEGAVPIGEAIADAREWVSVLCLEGMQTDDYRFIALDAIGWRPLPLTITIQLETAPEHDGASVAGRIDEIVKMPAAQALAKGLLPEGRDYPAEAVAVVAYGCFDDSWCGDEAMRLVGDRVLRGVSVELAVSEGELVELPAAPGQDFGDMLDVVVKAEVASACIVAFPAFAEAQIMLATQAAAGGLAKLDADAAVEDADEDAPAVAASASAWRFSIITASPVKLRSQLSSTRRFAAVDYSAGSMVAVHPTAQECSDCAQPGGQPAGDLHVTLAYFPDPGSVDFDAVHKIVGKLAAAHPVIQGQVGGAGYFAAPPVPPNPQADQSDDGEAPAVEDADAPPKPPAKPAPAIAASSMSAAAPPKQVAPDVPVAPPETDADDTPDNPEPTDSPEDNLPKQGQPLHPHVALVDAPGLTAMRQKLTDALGDAGIPFAETHDFVPHMTLGYEAEPGTPAVGLAGKPLTFGAMTVHEGQTKTDHPMQPADALTASAAGAAPVKPPLSWFDEPDLDEPTPLTITSDGRIYGHLATWGQCHVGIMDACVRPPRNSSGYRMYHLGEVETSEGVMIACGTYTLDSGHADLKLSAAATKRHYDDTGVAAADLVVGEDRHGIWAAGAVRPELSMAQVRKLRAAKPSGDWRTVGGAFEMIGVAAVNTPGFPVPRPTARVLAASAEPDGQRVVALVAAGIDLRPSDASPTRPAELWRLLDRALPGSTAERVEALTAAVL